MKIKLLPSAVLAVALIDLAVIARAHLRKPSESAVAATVQKMAEGSIHVSDLERPNVKPGELVPVDTPVILHLQQITAKGAGTEWIATYKNQGATARFRIEFDSPRRSKDPDDFPVASGEGSIFAMPNSAPSALLSALQTELKAHGPAKPAPHVASLPFSYAVLGEHYSKAKDSGFYKSPRGDWTAMKLFFGENTDEDEGEVFFNLNPVTGEGEFSAKDADYGDIVLRHLAKVL